MTSFTFSHAEADDWAGLAKSLADGLKAGAGNGGGDGKGDGDSDGTTATAANSMLW